jgi:hypothetical protein
VDSVQGELLLLSSPFYPCSQYYARISSSFLINVCNQFSERCPTCVVARQACAGELPTAEEAAQFDAIIVAGSHYSAYEQHEWIDQLMVLLRALAGQGTRMYGCCFGCQVSLGLERHQAALNHTQQAAKRVILVTLLVVVAAVMLHISCLYG